VVVVPLELELLEEPELFEEVPVELDFVEWVVLVVDRVVADDADDADDDGDDVPEEPTVVDRVPAVDFVRCFLWWCFAVAVFVSVSDFGAAVTPLAGVAAGESGVVSPVVAADEAAGASSATRIAPVPSTAPALVIAVTRRTRRCTRSRCAAAMPLVVVSMSPPSSLPLMPV
jgi:hypothetical protein